MREQLFYRLDVGSELMHVLDRIDILGDKSDYRLAIYNHPYQMTSVNWMHNDRIAEVFSREYREQGFDTVLETWLLVLNHIVYQWLSRKGVEVVFNKFVSFVPIWTYFKQIAENTDVPPWYPDKTSTEILDKAIHEQKMDELFPETFIELDEAYRLSGRQSFIEEKNINQEGIAIPVSIHIDPLFLTITFIH